MHTIQVKVCVKSKSCQDCGNPDAVSGGTWAFLNCNNGPLEGNEIQFYNDVDNLQFCELNILGIRKQLLGEPKTGTHKLLRFQVVFICKQHPEIRSIFVPVL